MSLGNWVCLLPTKPSHCKADQLRAKKKNPKQNNKKSSVSSCESPGRRGRDPVSEEMPPAPHPPPSSWDTGAAGLGQELAGAPSKGGQNSQICCPLHFNCNICFLALGS